MASFEPLKGLPSNEIPSGLLGEHGRIPHTLSHCPGSDAHVLASPVESGSCIPVLLMSDQEIP